MRGAAALGVLVVLIAAACGGTSTPDDPPRIVPWSALGSVRIGDTAGHVRGIYGPAVKSERLRLPTGTRYAGHAARFESFRVPGGTLGVTYVDGAVREIATDSARYRTPSGIGVGTGVSAGTCYHVEGNSCVYRWHGLEYDECGGAWVGEVGPVQLVIGMDRSFLNHPRGRISSIDFGDPDVVLYCF